MATSQAGPGYLSFAFVSLDSGATYVKVSEQKTASWRGTTDKIEVTNKTTSPNSLGMINKERIAVANDMSCTIDGNAIDDSVQQAMTTAWKQGTNLPFRFMRKIGSGLRMIIGNFLIEPSQNQPLTDAATYSWTLTLASGLDEVAQP